MEIEHVIQRLKDYPDNGKHQECVIDLPFEIRKGEDGYFWYEGDVEKSYNFLKGDKIDQRWIVHIDNGHTKVNASLKAIFKIKLSRDLNVILKYCLNLYVKSLKLEKKRISEEILRYKN